MSSGSRARTGRNVSYPGRTGRPCQPCLLKQSAVWHIMYDEYLDRDSSLTLGDLVQGVLLAVLALAVAVFPNQYMCSSFLSLCTRPEMGRFRLDSAAISSVIDYSFARRLSSQIVFSFRCLSSWQRCSTGRFSRGWRSKISWGGHSRLAGLGNVHL